MVVLENGEPVGTLIYKDGARESGVFRPSFCPLPMILERTVQSILRSRFHVDNHAPHAPSLARAI